MGAFIKKATALKCPIHRAVMDKVREELASTGCFHKADIIDELQYNAIEGSIRWDYVREIIQDEQKCELIPLAEAFFKRHKPGEMEAVPHRFVALGHGKKTAGYANISGANGALVICVLKQKSATRDGMVKSVNKMVASCKEKGVAIAQQAPAAQLEDKS